MRTRSLLLAASVPWAITTEALALILEVAARENDSLAAVEAKLGRPLDHAQTTTIRDRVAVVPVVGPIFRHANALTRVSGATSVEVLARDVRAAVDDPNVAAVLLHLDSPGGEVTGIHELAAMIHEARATKRIAAYVGGACCSAAYWIASATDEIIVDATARVGSIGVVAAVPNPAASSSKEIEIVSSQSPRKGLDPRTQEGRAAVLATVDQIADIFVDDVARHRRITRDKVLEGRGGQFVGAEAIAAGLADRIGSFESVVRSLATSPLRARIVSAVVSSSRPTTSTPAPSSAVAAASARDRAWCAKHGIDPAAFARFRDKREAARDAAHRRIVERLAGKTAAKAARRERIR
jgi:ClpP class serine protease